jgi:ACS family tartrate transporter-like MFS transporter
MHEPAPAAALEYASPVTGIHAERLFSKITWLLIPFMFLLYVVGYLDRINIGTAALTMKRDLSLSGTQYTFGAGIFFLGYFLLELPSNLILERVGARRWIARIMVTWGIIACAMMFVRGPVSLSSMRFLLGAAEAGFFPGMVLYLTYWFPAERRAKAMSSFFVATAIAGVIGGPISALCLKMGGRGGLAGWQWVFLLEGLPSILLGVAVLFILPDGPRQAPWLAPDERDWLLEHLRQEQARLPGHARHDLAGAMRDSRLWLLAGTYFLLMAGLYTFGFLAPLVLKEAAPDWTDSRIALYSGIPYLAASVSMVVVGRHSDVTGERVWHSALSAFVACAGFAVTAFTHWPATRLLGLTLGATGVWAMFGTFWTLPTEFLQGTAAAGGIALINSIGCLNGWLMPVIVGHLKDATHRFKEGLLAVAACLLFSGLLVLLMPRSIRQAPSAASCPENSPGGARDESRLS